MAKRLPEVPKWRSLREALAIFAITNDTQSQRHIKPLHWYVAARLVMEGGFHPDQISPRPPFRVQKSAGTYRLIHDPQSSVSREMTVLGGLKTKNVDVVVVQPGIGPCLALSMKGTHNAFRNLTNRMEEAAGDCTNIHMSYPALVYGFWSVLRANREGMAPANTPAKIVLGENRWFKDPDIAVSADGIVAVGIQRYHFALEGLNKRSNLRDEPSKYEAVGLTLVEADEERLGQVYDSFPDRTLGLTYESMFRTMYAQYDLRYVYQAPDLARRGTRRLLWSPDSPALANMPELDYEPRIGTGQPADDEGVEDVEPAAREIEEKGLGE